MALVFVLQTKYGIKNGLFETLEQKSGSFLWKGLSQMRSYVGLWGFPYHVQQLDRIGSYVVDQSERWIIGCNRYLGFCSVIEFELWGIKDGLELFLEWSYDSFLIQTDSMKAINAIQDQAPNGQIQHWLGEFTNSYLK
ncbi:hypothetical protein PVK06_024358 [Gossypium arboreum]|uniref:RNase H type-1 domain-containing protein n=1 Tax=Gossypium arboreum TaxID=29729 RepID=A0ABR0PDI1_GOSAR|nr:hypothetical protein PVK06_024358 [Gossypium arboreum]